MTKYLMEMVHNLAGITMNHHCQLHHQCDNLRVETGSHDGMETPPTLLVKDSKAAALALIMMKGDGKITCLIESHAKLKKDKQSNTHNMNLMKDSPSGNIRNTNLMKDCRSGNIHNTLRKDPTSILLKTIHPPASGSAASNES